MSRPSASELAFEVSETPLPTIGRGRVAAKFFSTPPHIELDRAFLRHGRFRFILAHEFSHFCLQRGIQVRRADYIADTDAGMLSDLPPARGRIEWQANRLAAALLVPRETLVAAIANARCDLARRDRNNVRKIVHHPSLVYDVSRTLVRMKSGG